jgi:hypothetical protein
MAIGGGGARPPWTGVTVQFNDTTTWIIWGNGTKIAYDSETGKPLAESELPPEDH